MKAALAEEPWQKNPGVGSRGRPQAAGRLQRSAQPGRAGSRQRAGCRALCEGAAALLTSSPGKHPPLFFLLPHTKETPTTQESVCHSIKRIQNSTVKIFLNAFESTFSGDFLASKGLTETRVFINVRIKVYSYLLLSDSRLPLRTGHAIQTIPLTPQ